MKDIPPERQSELIKLGRAPEIIDGITSMPMFQRSRQIKCAARLVLGIAAESDITELNENSSSELLFVMRTMRGLVFAPNQDE